MIYDQHRCIFVHIPKTAGRSIATALGYNPENWEIEQGDVHCTAAQYKAMDAEKFKQYYKFAVVRNPFDRMISMYFYYKNVSKTARLSEGIGFKEWLFSIKTKKQFRAQWEYITIDGVPALDEIYKFEYLTNLMPSLKIRIPDIGELPHENRSVHGNYQQYYDRETIELIEKAHEQDLNNFNYEF